MINKKMVVIAVAAVVVLNILLWVVFAKKQLAINYNNNITNHNEQYQQQWQGVITINNNMIHGKHYTWEYVFIDTENVTDSLSAAFKQLSLFSSMYSKVAVFRTGIFTERYTIMIIYPMIED